MQVKKPEVKPPRRFIRKKYHWLRHAISHDMTVALWCPGARLVKGKKAKNMWLGVWHKQDMDADMLFFAGWRYYAPAIAPKRPRYK